MATLNFICQSVSHRARLFRSSCRISQSLGLFNFYKGQNHQQRVQQKTLYCIDDIIDTAFKISIRKYDRPCFRARNSNGPDIRGNITRLGAHVQKIVRDVYWKYIEEPDTSSPDRNERFKKILVSYYGAIHRSFK